MVSPNGTSHKAERENEKQKLLFSGIEPSNYMEGTVYEKKILQIWFSGVNNIETNTKQKKYWEKITTDRKPNFIPVRGKNGSLLVKSISFSSSIGIDKLMSTCPRRK